MTLHELRERPHWSASSINQLLNICSLQYRFERVERLKKPFISSSLVFGTCIHRVLESWFRERMEGLVPDREAHKELFTQLWKMASEEQAIRYTEKEDREALAVKGLEVLECFVAHQDPEETVVAVSQPFCVPVHAPDGSVAELPLVGEFDLIVEKDGIRKIKDWKTAARKWSEGQADTPSREATFCEALSNARPPLPDGGSRCATNGRKAGCVFCRSASLQCRPPCLSSKATQIPTS